MAAEITVLRHDEAVRLDPDCLLELYASLGERRAERVVAAAMAEIAARMGELDRHVATGDAAGAARCADRLVAVARQIGMTGLARVATDVVAATSAADNAARAATVARLGRLGHRSLAAVWDIRDISV